MSKKIGKALLPELKEKINKVEIIPVEIDGEEFEVRANTFLSTEIRDRLMKNIQLTATEKNVDKYGGEILAFYSIFKTITDIDFGDSLEEGIELFTGLSDLGVIALIVNTIPEKMFHDITAALEMTQQVLEEMSKMNEVN